MIDETDEMVEWRRCPSRDGMSERTENIGRKDGPAVRGKDRGSRVGGFRQDRLRRVLPKGSCGVRQNSVAHTRRC
jgi:hypothetical protein